MAQRAVVGQQVGARHAVHVVQRHALHALAAHEHGAPVAHDLHVHGATRHRCGVGKLQLQTLADLDLGALELILADRLLREVFDDAEQQLLAQCCIIVGREHRADHEVACFTLGAGPGEGGLRQFGFHQRLVQTSRRLVSQNRCQHRQCDAVGVQRCRGVVPGHQNLAGRGAAHHDAALAVLHRFQRVGLGNRRHRLGHSTQRPLDTGQRLFHVKFARDDEHGVVGAVVAMIESLKRGDVHMLDVGAIAQRGLAVAVPGVSGGSGPIPERAKRVVARDLELVAHHGHLSVQVLLRDETVDHGVGLPAKVPVERLLVRGKGGVVVGAVVCRGAVVREPMLAQRRVRIGCGGRALEDQVLKQVRHAALARTFVARSDHVSQIHVDTVVGHIGRKQHLEAVRETVFRDALDRLYTRHASWQCDGFLGVKLCHRQCGEQDGCSNPAAQAPCAFEDIHEVLLDRVVKS